MIEPASPRWRRSHLLWGTAGGALVLLVITAALGLWLSSLWSRGRALESRAFALGAAIAPEVLVRDPLELQTFSRDIDSVQRDLDALVGDAGPALTIASGLGWVPWIGRDLRALSPLAERASVDLRVAATAAQTLAELRAAYDDLMIQALDPSAGPAASRVLVETTQTAGTQLRDAQATLAAAHARTAGIQPRAIAPLWAKVQKQEDQLKASLSVGASTADLLASLAEVQGTVQPLLGGGEDQSPSAQTLLERLRDLRVRAEAARDAIIAAQATVPGAPSLIQSLDALVTVGQGAELAAQSLVTVLDAFGDGPGGPLHNGPGLARALAKAGEEGARLDQAAELLRAGRLRMEDLEASGTEAPALFAEGLHETSRLAAEMEAAVRLVRDITPIAPALLGLDRPRTYVVLGHSPDELRPTGGFVSTLWFVTFDGGELADLRYQDVVLVDDWDRLIDYPQAPPALEEHMSAWIWLTRDVSWEPHFPMVAELAEDMIEIGQRRRVDGVIAVNQWTFLRWVEALGEVPSPDGGPPITANNFLTVLERARDLEEKSYLDLFLHGVLSRLDQSSDQQTMIRLAASMHSLLRDRQLLFYVNDPAVQQQLSRRGWTGEVRDEPGDYLFIADSNVGWSKVDRNIERGISYRVSLDADGTSHAALTLTYRNRSGPQASDCTSQWMPEERGDTYTRLLHACYWDYLRAYVPAGIQLRDAPSFPLPPNSISGGAGRRKEGDPTFTKDAAYGKTVLGGLLVVPAGEERAVTFLYDLPPGILEREGDRLRYRLLLQPQPGTRGRLTAIDIHLPTGYVVAASSLPVATIAETSVTYLFDLTQDTVLDLVLAPASPVGRG